MKYFMDKNKICSPKLHSMIGKQFRKFHIELKHGKLLLKIILLRVDINHLYDNVSHYDNVTYEVMKLYTFHESE